MKTKKARRTMIGGQALLEGVMMRGKSGMAMAVRDDKGDIRLETKRLKSRKWYNRVPLVRGVVAFVDSLVTGVSTLLKSAEVSTPDEEMPSKGAMSFSVVLGVLLAVALFILLPSGIAWLFEKYCGLTDVLYISLIEGGLRLLIFIGYLFAVSRLKDIRRTFMYHGAEHRTINCYEKGLPLTVENVQACSTRHNRCGTTFLFFVMVLSILVFALTNWALSYLGEIGGNLFVKFGVRLALLPLVAGLSYELLRGLAMLPDNVFTDILRAPGLALQRLTTYPPEDEMAEVAIASFNAVLEMDEDENLKTVSFDDVTVESLRARITRELPPTADGSEVDWILCDALGVKRGELSKYKMTTVKVRDRIDAVLDKRKTLPLDYCLGYSEFYGCKLAVGEGVLVPRPETELLAERVIRYVGEQALTVLDLCCGSGCIALSIANNTAAKVTAADISDDALAYAKKNLAGKNVEVVKSDLFAGLDGRKFDVIVCNPPYIKTDVLPTLDPEVRAEPALALDGGADGLDIYRRIAAQYREHLNDGGALFLEIGYDQGETVPALFCGGEVIKDYGGQDRIVVIRTADIDK